MKIAVGGDHAGLELKELLAEDLRSRGHEVVDVGAHGFDPHDDYPEFAGKVAETVLAGRAERGLLVCGSGAGVNVAVNKFPGLRAATCHDTYSARQGVEHDDLNVLCIGARVVGSELARHIVRAFVDARFSGEERHVRRLRKVLEIERRHLRAPPEERGG